MEVQDLKTVVLLFVLTGVLIGIGVLVLDSFGTAVKDVTTVTDNGVNITTTTTLTNVPCKALVSVTNSSGTTFSLATYNVSFTDVQTCTFDQDLPATFRYNITYTYYQNTTSSVALANSNNALQGISTNWLALIVTVVALSIVLGLVIRSFGGTTRR